jgi:hypothetical protein
LLWQDEQLSAISAALEAARSGQPTVLSVLGRPGTGKTSLLREIATRASGFNVLEADGQESAYREPLDLLRQLGVRDARAPGGISRTRWSRPRACGTWSMRSAPPVRC